MWKLDIGYDDLKLLLEKNHSCESLNDEGLMAKKNIVWIRFIGNNDSWFGWYGVCKTTYSLNVLYLEVLPLSQNKIITNSLQIG